MSEIVNGQRAHYAGTFLVSAGGHKFPTPQWFTADLSPDIQLNGVLSAGRWKRQDAVSVVENANPPRGAGGNYLPNIDIVDYSLSISFEVQFL